MYDGEMINFSEDYELNYILKECLANRKRETEENRKILTAMGKDYKETNNVRIIYHREEFYTYVNNHKSYSSLEDF